MDVLTTAAEGSLLPLQIRLFDGVAATTDDGEPVADIVFLCDYEGGEPIIGDPDEIAEVLRLTAA